MRYVRPRFSREGRLWLTSGDLQYKTIWSAAAENSVNGFHETAATNPSGTATGARNANGSGKNHVHLSTAANATIIKRCAEASDDH
jgi:hypothetical protein